MKVLLGIVVAIVTLKWWPDIPEISTLAVASFFFLVILLALRKHVSVFFIGLTLGCLVASSSAALFKYKTISALTVAQNTTIAGKVGSLFTAEKLQTSVIFDVDTVNGRKLTTFETFRVRLYWRSEEPVKQGQRWEITARLREPYGRLNEAGFDAETYFLSRHIHSKGTVLTAQIIDDTSSYRQQLFEKIQIELGNLPSSRYLVALAFGERSLLQRVDWTQLRDTGLAHLLAISGLHIGLAFFFGDRVTKLLLPIVRRRDNALWLAALVGLLCAFGYAWVAGFTMTAQRALIALVTFSLVRQTGFSVSPFNTFLIVLTVVLVSDPLSIFSASFWLSFGAVFVLCIMSLTGERREHKDMTGEDLDGSKDGGLATSCALIKRYFLLLWRMQVFLTLGMLPFMWAWFGGISMTAIVYNLIAVPLVSLVTVPLILIALILSPFMPATWVWTAADLSLSPLLLALDTVALGWLEIGRLSGMWLMVVILFVVLVTMLNVRRSLVLLGVVAMILLTWGRSTNNNADWRVDVLDVGHGLAVLIEKDGEAILYDTGAAWTSSSIAESVVYSVLQSRGSALVGLILSHRDNDHAGGAEWVIAQIGPQWVRASENNVAFLPCKRGETWRWKGLDFDVLYPLMLVDEARNPDSCVIRVSDGENAVLLTGDLPAKGEDYLVEQNDDLDAQVLIVPHHGSKTSSSALFIDHVRPKVAIASTGRYTPWNLPNPDVVARYHQRNIAWYETGKHGQVSVRFSSKGWRVLSHRLDLEPYWYRKKFGAPKRKE
ncbi:DNA internalization-related competence protein ComEC/Rec2 [Enterovibrio norvegicus FF-162]|uniref:DNA internalization-related competence protein ComEC/Rec2 n=1 Tax=Enterovibrio norvegicus FF-454 TaxID=1185651 RepID=A0A1E5BY67_9GAMM|nr:DNA internalization-related competence protein ComEC/Rec2 [Enterovibrio norvegicus]OEE58140.1 DNA internalization-related competence protein ComEC/Rec2 [Enterovibrio norvegicus FF-454]OEE75141.1 DNA internalization-related competence protein ComEC/Rec2 [Enterovibrio norvegicus FF-162]